MSESNDQFPTRHESSQPVALYSSKTSIRMRFIDALRPMQTYPKQAFLQLQQNWHYYSFDAGPIFRTNFPV